MAYWRCCTMGKLTWPKSPACELQIMKTSHWKSEEHKIKIFKQPVSSVRSTRLSKLRITTTQQNCKRHISVCSFLWTIPWYSHKLCLRKYTTISNSSLTERNTDNTGTDGCSFFTHACMPMEPLSSCQETSTCDSKQKAKHMWGLKIRKHWLT